jgi:hypothetical protein
VPCVLLHIAVPILLDRKHFRGVDRHGYGFPGL